MELTFQNNISAKLTNLNQWRTYNGHISGMHTDYTNKLLLERTVTSLKKKYNLETLYFIEPLQRLTKTDRVVRHGIPMTLPEITCVASLRRFSKTESPSMTWLLLVWLQDEYCFPINEHVAGYISEIDWYEFAEPFEF